VKNELKKFKITAELNLIEGSMSVRLQERLGTLTALSELEISSSYWPDLYHFLKQSK